MRWIFRLIDDAHLVFVTILHGDCASASFTLTMGTASVTSLVIWSRAPFGLFGHVRYDTFSCTNPQKPQLPSLNSFAHGVTFVRFASHGCWLSSIQDSMSLNIDMILDPKNVWISHDLDRRVALKICESGIALVCAWYRNCLWMSAGPTLQRVLSSMPSLQWRSCFHNQQISYWRLQKRNYSRILKFCSNSDMLSTMTRSCTLYILARLPSVDSPDQFYYPFLSSVSHPQMRTLRNGSRNKIHGILWHTVIIFHHGSDASLAQRW